MKMEAGFSMISSIVALGIAGIVAIIFSDSASMLLKSQGRLSTMNDLEVIKQTLVERLDCSQTLNSTMGGPVLNCANYASVALKRRGGVSLGGIGKWQVNAGCKNNEIIVTLARPGKDPLTGREWNEMSFATDDLFKGESNFCRGFFDPDFKRYKAFPLIELVDYMEGGKCAGGWQGCFGSCSQITSGDTPQQFTNANAACHRACRKQDWVGGVAVECSGVNPDPAYHYVGCFCAI